MKGTCAYCDSYIDIDENTVCPNCGAPLKEAKEELERKETETAKKQRELELEKEKLRLKAEEDAKFMELGMGIAAVALGATGGDIAEKAIKKIFKNK